MRKALLIYLSLIPFISFAQVSGNITIEWLEKKEISIGNILINAPQFSGKNYYYDVSKNAITYTLKISESASFDEKNIQITNLVYESIPTSYLGDLDPKEIPETPNAFLKTTTSRNLEQTFLVLSPIVKDNFGFKRIKLVDKQCLIML